MAAPAVPLSAPHRDVTKDVTDAVEVSSVGAGSTRPWSRAGVVGAILTAALSTAVLIQAMRLWEWTPGTPLGLDGDNASVTTWVRTIVEYGPYSDNPRLGAPFTQNLGWFPTGDDVHFLALWLLGHVADSAFTVVALYFFVGFPLAALTMYWLARTEQLSVSASRLFFVLFYLRFGSRQDQ